MTVSVGEAGEAIPPQGASVSVPADLFRQGMRRVPGAVAIIATAHGGDRRGFTATAWCSLSVDPPTLLVCANRSGGAHDLIAASRIFTVNQLAVGQHDVAGVFSGAGGVAGGDRFKAAGSWSTLATGAPVLDKAVANYDCELVESVRYTTHSVFMGRVVATRLDDSIEPLVYLLGGYGEFGAAS